MTILKKVPAVPNTHVNKSNQTEGVVKWFSDTKGFGFLTADNDPTDVFVHYSAIQSDAFKTIREGQRVAFDLQTGPKGPQAQNVVVL